LLPCSVGLLASASTSSALLSDIFRSNGGSFGNDTIPNFTSPLAFTEDTGRAEPVLNASNSTISLNYGTYYAIAFISPRHVGAGEISFSVDGGPLITQAVTFPIPTAASAVFASFSLINGDTVTMSALGLSADRIRIVGDGGGLAPDGTADAYYKFDYISAIPEPATAALLIGGGMLALALGRRRRA
jgi:hypothetical protein